MIPGRDRHLGADEGQQPGQTPLQQVAAIPQVGEQEISASQSHDGKDVGGEEDEGDGGDGEDGQDGVYRE
jgi:hypothetical protein